MEEMQLPPDERIRSIQERYKSKIAPIFFPEEPARYDIVQLFCSVLRVSGMEDKGWDPYEESRGVLNDLDSLLKIDLPKSRFEDPDITRWRIGLLLYQHIVEMSAPYEVLANLLRYRPNLGYRPNPFFDFLEKKDKKRYQKIDIPLRKKIEIISDLCRKSGQSCDSVIKEVYNPKIRNAIAHSDYIFADNGFRHRRAHSIDTFGISYESVDYLITKAKNYILMFFGIENSMRSYWGEYSNKCVAYDPTYKGVMEVLSDKNGLMTGFKVHWPNNSESFYERTESGVNMVNCIISASEPIVDLFVGIYARAPGSFSPLVEAGKEPVYTPLRNGTPTTWPY